jgi:3-hydroxy acid dehydrogenase / malonic semialdehyde reductase
MQTQLANRWIIITGASSGFGAAAARAFAAQKACLLLGARRMPQLKAVVDDALRAGAPQAHCQALDVARTESVEAFVSWVRSHTSRVDVLVNNAGGAHGMDAVKDAKDEDWEAMVQSNFLGLLRMTRAVLPLMTAGAGSSIINIGSLAGRTAYEGGAAYCGCKAAELQVTRALRLELCGTGIRVCTLDPGLAETEFSLVRFKGDIARAKKVYEGVQPLTGEDVAEAIVWVASRPAHVCIDEMLIKCTDQAAIHKVNRRAVT